jgi:hypothetical protein
MNSNVRTGMDFRPTKEDAGTRGGSLRMRGLDGGQAGINSTKVKGATLSKAGK